MAFQAIIGERTLTALQLFASVYAFWYFKLIIFERTTVVAADGSHSTKVADTDWWFLLEPTDPPTAMFFPMAVFMGTDFVIGVQTLI